MGSTTPLPYWQINIPPEKREAQCPSFLANLNAKDIAIISTPDEHYQLLTWPEVQSIIVKNRIDLFQRLPSDLRRYLQYNSYLKQEYGSVMNFVLKERLQWAEPVISKGKPFEDETDVKILWNDWPYGLDKRIVHLVVWTKFELVDDEETGDLTLEARRQVDDYVDENFGRVVGKQNVGFSSSYFLSSSWLQVTSYTTPIFDFMPVFFVRWNTNMLQGDLVQELEDPEIDTCRGTLPCHAIQSGYGLHQKDHKW